MLYEGETHLHGIESSIHHPTHSLGDKDRGNLAERILCIALEIIHQLIGQDYTVVKKTPNSHSITVPPSHSLIHERHNDQKILDLTNKIIQLLTGEVPIRCEDVTVYFSMEEWEYIEEHRGLYKDVMMENHRPLTSLDGASNRNSSERCPRPLYSHDSQDENLSVPYDYQGANLKIIMVDLPDIEGEETYVRDDQQFKGEEIPTDISTDGPRSTKSSEGHLGLSTDCKIEDNDIAQYSPEKNMFIPNIHPVLSCAAVSSDPYTNYDDCLYHDDSLILQQKADTDDKRFPNSACRESITQTSGISVQQSSLTGENPFPCPECGKCFTLRSYLVKHQRIHAALKPYSCSDCGKCFTKKSHHLQHQRMHTGEKPFSCSDCGKYFAHKSNFDKHQKIHSGEKPFSCSECGKRFTQKTNHLQHQRIHTGEKPFSCSYCGKCFTQKSGFHKHLKIHTGEKPYTCSECEKCFTHKSHLIQHQTIHTGEKPFSCSLCGKYFAHKSSYYKHQRVHTGAKPFSCSDCGKCFTQKSSLVRHQRVQAHLQR
ncbi:zinc finger protein 773-like isoform X2 [Pseudophryne corroboree]|uniref:zinc finger protein 773-like isoform X2 n=1 Tax=Pseudophryne corroboree TaxID=495146 RepID=UPI003081986D